MGIKDLFGFFDNGLESAFRGDGRSIEEARAHVLRGIARTREDFARHERLDGSRWVALSNDVVAFTPTRPDGGPIEINGVTTNFIAADRFEAFLAHFATAVEAGEFDGALTGSGIGSSQHVGGAFQP